MNIIMKLWIARDLDTTLKLHFEEPILFPANNWISSSEKELDPTLFPEVSFENSPMEVKLKLIEK